MMSLEDALITCLLHSSKEQWIILLVYWAASQLYKCLSCFCCFGLPLTDWPVQAA